MGIFDFLIGSRAKIRKRRRKSRNYSSTVKHQLSGIKVQIDAINTVLDNHQKGIAENSLLLKEHSRKLSTLEELLSRPQTSQPSAPTNPTIRPDWPVKPAQSGVNGNNNKLDIDKFSQQEKKILSVLFSHQDMALSYRDIAGALNKAPTTIKNQIHQILLKADIFEKVIDTGMVNRFRLKDGLKIEKYLTNRA